MNQIPHVTASVSIRPRQGLRVGLILVADSLMAIARRRHAVTFYLTQDVPRQ